MNSNDKQFYDELNNNAKNGIERLFRVGVEDLLVNHNDDAAYTDITNVINGKIADIVNNNLKEMLKLNAEINNNALNIILSYDGTIISSTAVELPQPQISSTEQINSINK